MYVKNDRCQQKKTNMKTSSLTNNLKAQTELVIDLQSRLLLITEHNFGEVQDHIFSNFLQSKNLMNKLLFSLKHITNARPSLLRFVCDLLSELSTDIIKYFTPCELIQIFTNKTILLTLFDLGLLTIDLILKQSDHNNTFKFFVEQIQAMNNEYFCQKIDSTPILFLFCQKINYVDHRAYQMEGSNSDRVATAIRYDDLVNFQYFAKNTAFYSKILYSIYDSNEYVSNVWKRPTYIEYAAFYGAKQAFNYLLNMYENNNIAFDHELIEYAVAGGCIEIINVLHDEKGIIFTEKCLINSICYFHLELFERIINEFKTKNISFDMKNVLFECLSCYNVNLFISLFNENEKCINEKNPQFNNMTILHLACKYGYVDIVEILLSHKKIKVNERDDMWQTPLHIAVKNSHLSVVDLLMKSEKTDINAKDALGQNILHFASSTMTDNCDMVKKLLNSKQKIDVIMDIEGQLPIHIAASMGNLKILEFLFEVLKMDINVRNKTV